MRRRGTTLIEVLIAVSLLGLLSAGVMIALRVGLRSLERTNAKLVQNRRAVSVQRILESEIAGFLPTMAGCPSATPGLLDPVPFFEGLPNQMRFVSTYSLTEAGRGHPRILEFRVIPGENGEGVRLIVNETLYTGPLSTGVNCLGVVADALTAARFGQFRPVVAGERSFVLADRLASCNFLYLYTPPQPEPEVWVSEWRRSGWPRALRIQMRPLETDPTRVPLLSVVGRIHINRRAEVKYVD